MKRYQVVLIVEMNAPHEFHVKQRIHAAQEVLDAHSGSTYVIRQIVQEEVTTDVR